MLAVAEAVIAGAPDIKLPATEIHRRSFKFEPRTPENLISCDKRIAAGTILERSQVVPVGKELVDLFRKHMPSLLPYVIPWEPISGKEFALVTGYGGLMRRPTLGNVMMSVDRENGYVDLITLRRINPQEPLIICDFVGAGLRYEAPSVVKKLKGEKFCVSPDAKVQQHSDGAMRMFANRSIREGHLIEVSPFVALKGLIAEGVSAGSFDLGRYIAKLGDGDANFALGYIGVYRRDERSSNVRIKFNHKTGLVKVRAKRDIDPGEELIRNSEVEFKGSKPQTISGKYR